MRKARNFVIKFRKRQQRFIPDLYKAQRNVLDKFKAGPTPGQQFDSNVFSSFIGGSALSAECSETVRRPKHAALEMTITI